MGQFEDILKRAWIVLCFLWLCFIGLIVYNSAQNEVSSHATLARAFVDPVGVLDLSDEEAIRRAKALVERKDFSVASAEWPPPDKSWATALYPTAAEALAELRRQNDTYPDRLARKVFNELLIVGFLPMLIGPALMMIGRFIFTGRFTRPALPPKV